MTDNEIIKCLRHCRAGDCENCKALNVCDATFSFHKEALDLINRQKTEIEMLNADVVIAETNEKNAKELLKEFCNKKSISEYPVKVMIGDNAEIHAKSTADYEKVIADISNISEKKLTQAICRQFPTKVTHEATLRICCTCPNCKKIVDKFEKFGDSTIKVRYDYCMFCGQALDWSDEQ